MQLSKDFQDFLKLTACSLALVVRKRRLDDVDEDAERRACWATRTLEERSAEVENVRRVWIEQTGDPDAPSARLVLRRSMR